VALTEADTCRMYVLPKLYAAGWTDDQISEQKTFTDGRIIVAGNKVRRLPQKRADYLLRYARDFMIAVVEAKHVYRKPGDGLQKAKDYAQILGLKFAYSTNGTSIVEHDFLTGLDRDLETFPSPSDLWRRLRQSEGIEPEDIANRLLTPTFRYYQEIAVNRTVQAVLQGKRRILLNLATGTGKTIIAFQICLKLWSSRWNRAGEYRRPKILYLADRNILIDDPKDKIFTPFGDARWKIEGEAIKGREMYFAIYQAIAKDERRPGLYRDYAPDFFDLIIVDECHRGSAADESNWREILEYFHPAVQIGMTATPLREDNKDTYRYFGNPLYTYSLRQGIDDGFLAPYRVHRVVTTVDAAGWRPDKGELDRYGRAVPDKVYGTREFEREVALRARTAAIARHLSDYLRNTDRFAKTIVFCVDQEHAEEMRKAPNNLNADLAQEHPDYACRVISDEGQIGRGHLSRFQEPEIATPVIVTTSQMLTTGVDIQTCKNVALARVINSMTEFKQIIGRGTRVLADYGKYFFSILDYTGSATRLFADPEFDGDPALITQVDIDQNGQLVPGSEVTETPVPEAYPEEEETLNPPGHPGTAEGPEGLPRKYYVDGGIVEIAAHLVYVLDPDGSQLRVVKLTDYTADKVRTLFTSAADLRARWSDAEQRALVISALEERGIAFERLAEVTKQPEADPFDLLCHVAFNTPLRTRRERADRLRKEQRDFFQRHGPEAHQILDEILEKYAEHGMAQFKIPEILKVPPISDHGNVLEITEKFGGPDRLREALAEMQSLLYAA